MKFFDNIHLIKLFICFTVFLFNPKSLTSQNEEKVDSLERVIESSKNDTIIMDVYNSLRRATTFSNQKASQKYTFKFLEYSQKLKDSFKIALANYYLGNSYVASSDFEEALTYYFKAEEYFDRKKDSSRLSSILNGIGAAYENNGSDSLSLKYFFMSRDISKARKDMRRSGIASNNISNVYKKRGDLEATITHLNDAVEDLNDPKFSQYFIPLSINLANTYSQNNESQKALSIYNDMLKKIDTTNDVLNYAATLRGLGNTYISINKNNEGLDYLKKAYSKYANGSFFDDRFKTLKDLIDAYKINNQHEQALTLFYEYNTIKDSIFSTEKDKNLSEAIQKYETEKKDKEIATQQVLLKQNETEILKKQSEFRLALLVGSLLLIISLGIWLFFRQRQKLKNKEIETLKTRRELNKLEALIEGEEKERKRIAQDLHDGINGDLAVIKYKITLDNKNALAKSDTEVIQMLDNAIDQVRHISQNLAPPSLQNFNIVEALRQLCVKMSSTATTQIDFQYYGNLITLDKDSETAIYRIVQELVYNIVKHAKAKKGLVQINNHDDTIHIIVEDDGIGFDNTKSFKGLGLKNIKSRIAFLNADMQIDTNTKGSTFTISIDTNNLTND